MYLMIIEVNIYAMDIELKETYYHQWDHLSIRKNNEYKTDWNTLTENEKEKKLLF